MLIEYSSAREIFLDFRRSTNSCNDALAAYSVQAAAERTAALRLLVAQFMGNSWLGLMRPLQERFPDLELLPASGSPTPDEARTNGPNILDNFLVLSHSAVSKNEKAILFGETNNLFRPGTLQEIKDSIAEIDNFSKSL